MSYFKLVFLLVFSLAIVAGMAIFALSKSNSSGVQSANISVWGTMPIDNFLIAFEASSLGKGKNINVKYTEKDPSDFDLDFVEALAEGNGPDIVILRDDLLYKNRNKLVVIPYNSFSERTFKDTFIEQGEMFLTENGITAIPFMVDPLVMYWNRDMFSNSQISQTPIYWEQLPNIINKLTKKDASGNIYQSAIAFGEWSNITNAKEVVSMLLMQAGTPITTRSSGAVVSVLNSSLGYPTIPGQSAMDFYTQFSNQTSQLYSWNRSLPSSINFFLSGNLAMYFGYSSELFKILKKNSNLNYDVAMVPQIKDTKKKLIFGRMHALAITKQSKQVAASYMVINSLVEPAALLALEKGTSLPPVRRDMLSNIPADAYRSVFYKSALISRSFIDPDPAQSSRTFRDMVESITSGKNRVSDALSRASAEIDSELK